MLAAGVLRPMAALLQHSKRGLRKEACWAISNITAGSADQIDAVVRADLVPLLVHLLKTAEFDVKKEACWALSNATSGGRGDHVRYLCAQGAVPALCDILATRDAAIIKVALEAIENVLKHGKREAERTRHSNVANVVRMRMTCQFVNFTLSCIPTHQCPFPVFPSTVRTARRAVRRPGQDRVAAGARERRHLPARAADPVGAL